MPEQECGVTALLSAAGRGQAHPALRAHLCGRKPSQCFACRSLRDNIFFPWLCPYPRCESPIFSLCVPAWLGVRMGGGQLAAKPPEERSRVV